MTNGKGGPNRPSDEQPKDNQPEQDQLDQPNTSQSQNPQEPQSPPQVSPTPPRPRAINPGGKDPDPSIQPLHTSKTPQRPSRIESNSCHPKDPPSCTDIFSKAERRSASSILPPVPHLEAITLSHNEPAVVAAMIINETAMKPGLSPKVLRSSEIIKVFEYSRNVALHLNSILEQMVNLMTRESDIGTYRKLSHIIPRIISKYSAVFAHPGQPVDASFHYPLEQLVSATDRHLKLVVELCEKTFQTMFQPSLTETPEIEVEEGFFSSLKTKISSYIGSKSAQESDALLENISRAAGQSPKDLKSQVKYSKIPEKPVKNQEGTTNSANYVYKVPSKAYLVMCFRDGEKPQTLLPLSDIQKIINQQIVKYVRGDKANNERIMNTIARIIISRCHALQEIQAAEIMQKIACSLQDLRNVHTSAFSGAARKILPVQPPSRPGTAGGSIPYLNKMAEPESERQNNQAGARRSQTEKTRKPLDLINENNFEGVPYVAITNDDLKAAVIKKINAQFPPVFRDQNK